MKTLGFRAVALAFMLWAYGTDQAMPQPLDLYQVNFGGGVGTITFPGQPDIHISFPVSNRGFQLGSTCDSLAIIFPPGSSMTLTVSHSIVISTNGFRPQRPVTMDPLPYVASFPSGGKMLLSKKNIANPKYEAIDITGPGLRLEEGAKIAPNAR